VGKSTHNGKTIADSFNKHFISVARDMLATEKITKTLKIIKSYGYDEISTKVLSCSIYYISSPLTYIINRMLSSGIFRSRLKFAEVKPLFKTSEKK